ncbi:MAG TPA: cyclic pyranopterin monophosphate synthase MoaC [Candidatus Deferrimicrobiaceae bacterium]
MGATGRARMADITGKEATGREAVAEGWVFLSRTAWGMIRDGRMAKGDVPAVARVAGILAAKDTPRLLPLCHPIPLSSVGVEVTLPRMGALRVEATVRTVAPTGVEMEALAAVAAAALCVYDMAKPVDRGIRIEGIRLLRKTGGKSGDYLARSPRTPRRSTPASRKASSRSPGKRGRGPKRSR